jgi:ribonuclease HI
VRQGVLRSDGGARGNPGPAGAGFVIEEGGEIVCRGGRFLGECTNNVAEYEALLWGLENALGLGIDSIVVYADSELLVKQLNGQYRVKNE